MTSEYGPVDLAWIVELEHVHVAYCNRAVEVLACTSVSESQLTCLRIAFLLEELDNVALVCSVEYRSRNVPSL